MWAVYPPLLANATRNVGSLSPLPADVTGNVGSLSPFPANATRNVGSLSPLPTNATRNVGSLSAMPANATRNVGNLSPFPTDATGNVGSLSPPILGYLLQYWVTQFRILGSWLRVLGSWPGLGSWHRFHLNLRWQSLPSACSLGQPALCTGFPANAGRTSHCG